MEIYTWSRNILEYVWISTVKISFCSHSVTVVNSVGIQFIISSG